VGSTGPRAIAVSPDGRHVYVASSPGFRGYATAGTIAALARNLRTGALRQAAGPAGCVAAAGVDGCTAARQLVVPEQIVTSSDGRHV
jgi:DNA-binding beta-propeller fold protein YncE